MTFRVHVPHDATNAEVADAVHRSGVRGRVEVVRDPPPGRSPWTLAWVAWLVAFLAIELPAAFGERGTKSAKTLSRHVWGWFPWPWWRADFGLFWALVGLHFVVEFSVIPTIALGAGVAARIAWCVWRERGTRCGRS